VTVWPYDLTAEFYDEDMGRNTDGRDVAWYLRALRRIVAIQDGPVLELGSGTGRVTLPLAEAGLNVVALDRSVPMLRVLARKADASGCRGQLRILAGDMGAPSVDGRFSAVVCPFSAFTYLVDNADRSAMLAWVRHLLAPDGTLLLDLFIPDPSLAGEGAQPEMLDYQRTLPPGPWDPAVSLVRSKQITNGARPGVNRIERRYRFLASNDQPISEVRTVSFQRPYTPEALLPILVNAGFDVLQVCGDFDPATPAAFPARTAAIEARVSTLPGTAAG
jgi:SAM-dependent methyltransferase